MGLFFISTGLRRTKELSLKLEQARTGHFDHHLSPALQQIAGFAFKMHFEKRQRAVGVIVKQNTD
jgi:hypothetical protein